MLPIISRQCYKKKERDGTRRCSGAEMPVWLLIGQIKKNVFYQKKLPKNLLTKMQENLKVFLSFFYHVAAFTVWPFVGHCLAAYSLCATSQPCCVRCCKTPPHSSRLIGQPDKRGGEGRGGSQKGGLECQFSCLCFCGC